jgi:hypothetical protein
LIALTFRFSLAYAFLFYLKHMSHTRSRNLMFFLKKGNDCIQFLNVNKFVRYVKYISWSLYDLPLVWINISKLQMIKN